MCLEIGEVVQKAKLHGQELKIKFSGNELFKFFNLILPMEIQ